MTKKEEPEDLNTAGPRVKHISMDLTATPYWADIRPKYQKSVFLERTFPASQCNV